MVWQPCELLYTCYLLTYFRRGHRRKFYWASRYGRGAVILWPSDGSVLPVLWVTSCLDIHRPMWPATRKGRIGVPKVTQLELIKVWIGKPWGSKGSGRSLIFTTGLFCKSLGLRLHDSRAYHLHVAYAA